MSAERCDTSAWHLTTLFTTCYHANALSVDKLHLSVGATPYHSSGHCSLTFSSSSAHCLSVLIFQPTGNILSPFLLTRVTSFRLLILTTYFTGTHHPVTPHFFQYSKR